MSPLEALVDAAREERRHIVLAEGEDPRVVAGAVRAAREGVAQITLVGDEDKVTHSIEEIHGSGAAVGAQRAASRGDCGAAQRQAGI